MPAVLEARPRERLTAFVAVALIQIVFGFALINGLRVSVVRPGQVAEKLIDIALSRPPPPVPPPPPPPKPEHHASAAPKAQPTPPGAQPTPKPVPAQAPPTPKIAIKPTPSPSAGGSGTGAAFGAGSGGGAGGYGNGAGNGDDGGTDLELISGQLTQSDVPRDLRDNHIGGRVEFMMTVGPNGRVTRCAITRSSGVPRLDQLTCSLVQQRFVFRPSTDRYGRPITDEMDGVQDWIAR